MRAQPRSARGTIEHPYSALNLRLLLAGVGFVACVVLAVVSWRLRLPVALTVLAALFAAVGAVDLVVIQLRRRTRRREDPRCHSLFE